MNYKIMQFTDCHLSENTQKEGLDVIEALWNSASPDLSVFTGDIVFGKRDLEFYNELNEFFREKNKPFAVTLGNHEGEGKNNSVTRKELIAHCASLSHCLTEPNTIGSRYGNTIIDTAFGGVSAVILDSGDYMPKAFRLLHPFRNKYAALTEEQIRWYEKVAKDKKAVFVFMHIPLPEYERAYYGALARGEVKYGALRENIAPDGSLKRMSDVVCHGGINTGFFVRAKALGNLKAIFAGHDHLNDFCVDYQGVALIFGQKTVGTEGTGYSNLTRGFPDNTGATLVEISLDGSFKPTQVYYKDIL